MEDEEQLHSRTVAAFETYFKPQSTEIHYRIMFSKRNQRTDETDENLILDLQDLSLKCGWDEDYSKFQMLAEMVDKTLSQKLQLDPNLTVDVITLKMRVKEVLLKNQRLESDGVEADMQPKAVAAINRNKQAVIVIQVVASRTSLLRVSLTTYLLENYHKWNTLYWQVGHRWAMEHGLARHSYTRP